VKNCWLGWVLLVVAAVLCGCVKEIDTELVAAAAQGNVEEIKSLLAQGANPDAIAFESWTPLAVAAKSGHREAATVLLMHGAQVDRITPGGNTALFWAVQGNQLGLITLLLEAGARPTNIPDESGQRQFWKMLDEPERRAAKAIITIKGFRPN
jgi:ankyrin repeat protein